MARIPTYDQDPGAGQLGGTTKLQASVDAGMPFKALAGALGAGADVMKQYEAVKDAGFEADAQVSRQNALNAAEMEFHNAIAPQDGSAPTMSIEQKPEFMRQRMDDWASGVQSGWKGTDDSLKSVMNWSSLKTEREEAGYNAQVRAFELERSMVSNGLALENAVYSGDEMLIETYKPRYEAIAGPQKTQQIIEQAETASAYDKYVNVNSIQGIKNAQQAIKDGSAWDDYPNVNSKTRSQIKNATNTQYNALITARNKMQRDNETDMYVELEQGRLSYEAVAVAEEQGEQWDSVGEPAGITSQDALVMRKRLDTQIGKTIPEKWKNRFSKFRVSVSKDSWGGWNSALESEKELQKFKENIYKDDSLDANQKAYLFYSAAKAYNLTRNPKVAKPLADAMNTLTRMEADIISVGGDVNLGESTYSLLRDLDDNATPEMIATKLNERKEILNASYDVVILSRLSSRNIITGQESGGYIIGRTYTDANGNSAVWNGTDFVEAE